MIRYIYTYIREIRSPFIRRCSLASITRDHGEIQNWNFSFFFFLNDHRGFLRLNCFLRLKIFSRR